ncbi:MAG TPA: hypothetical protein VNK96_09535 [Fimbriimonadales bacterium]|nr:hypothetical protein [Fimbriimonadales bacterium]
MTKKHVFPVLFSLLLGSLLFAQDAVTLAWKPTVGMVNKYKVEVNSTMDMGDGQPHKVVVNFNITEKILKIRDDGNIEVEATQGEMGIVIDGQDLGQGMPSQTSVTVMKPNGETLERKTENAPGMDNPRLEESFTFIYPDKPLRIGDTWTRKVKADAKKGTVDAEATYKYEGTETVNGQTLWKVSYQFKETGGDMPFTVSGVVWLSSKDGTLFKGEYTMKNVEFQPGVRADATAKVTKVG